MADVARRAGVSTMTVSRALKAGGSVSQPTRQRILEAVLDLGYVLDQTAGTLSSKRSGFVAALIPSLNNSNFSETVHALGEAIERSGRQLLLGTTGYHLQKEERLIETMLRRRPEGIIVTGGHHTPRARHLLASSGVPVLETWDMPSEPIGHVVGFANAATARAMVHHLYGRGYRAIGFLGGATSRDVRGMDRRLGFVQAVAELGLPPGRIVGLGEPPASMDHGQEGIVRLLDQWPDTDAAICVSDLPAFGALMECHRRGWAVPGRIAVAGFGDFELSRYSYPRLTTVSVGAFNIGQAAGQLMVRSIDAANGGHPPSPQTIATPYAIMQRETT